MSTMRNIRTIESSRLVPSHLLGRTPAPGVLISSTSLDLYEHRREVKQACRDQGLLPIMMEDLPVSLEGAIETSLKMANDAHIYLGIFGFRYGYVPTVGNSEEISITEIEYKRAVVRGIPRLIFIAGETHSALIGDIEVEKPARLAAFKKRLASANPVHFFKSPADLGSQVRSALTPYRFESHPRLTLSTLETSFNKTRLS